MTFWRGSQPFVSRAMVVGACQVAVYDQFRVSFARMLNVDGSSFAAVFPASMSAGLIYSLITAPLETAKNRQAFQRPDANGVLPYRSTYQTITSIAAQDGARALWSGFAPYYLRCGGHTVTMFVLVEEIRKFWNKMT